MEMNHLTRKRNLDAKIPEIRKTLEMVQFLESEAGDEDDSKEIETMYELNDTLYATAKIKPTGKVCLWLGVSLFDLFSFSVPLVVLYDMFLPSCR
jgi:prefoldin subunit 5